MSESRVVPVPQYMRRWSGSDGTSGIAAVLTAAGRAWGSAVALEAAR
ncbi:hypothetical protein OHA63_35350 [Streptomyces anulatus]|nr:hypothetical protein [Streptomyces anulatus]